jgi:hypothetical protein
VGDEIVTILSDKSLNAATKMWKGYKVYGVSWDKGSSAELTRTNASVGMVANAGEGASTPTNDFDTAEMFGDLEEVTDSLGNVFVKFPLHWIRKTSVDGKLTKQMSYASLPGGYRPWCFYDFVNHKWLDYILVGKYVASESGGKLESKAGTFPLINQNIVTFRNYAQANNTGGLNGYQQMDIHVYDMLQTWFTIEYATLDGQSKMQGWTTGRYTATDLATVTETSTNRIIVANATAALYAVGLPIAVGTSQGGNQVFYGRLITGIDVYDASNMAISFDGAAVNITAGNYLYNVGWKNGFSSSIAASSGSLISNGNGKSPMVYRGVENIWGNVWQWIDGINITEWRAWVCKNAAQYASNLFVSPYEQLGYLNSMTNNYVKYMGYDPLLPFCEFPVDVSANYYRDYYYQASGQRVAPVGGRWSDGSIAGPWFWSLIYSSSSAFVYIGGRLLKKPL